jgi:hypothetical protein
VVDRSAEAEDHPRPDTPMNRPRPTALANAVLTLLLLAAASGSAIAQQNPLEAPVPKKGAGAAAPVGKPAGGGKVYVPDFIKPGARFVYALWLPKHVLEAYVTADPLQVVNGPYELNGRTYDTRTLTRITKESAMRQVWDRGTGLKLTEQTGVGQPRRAGDPTGFNRKITGTNIYQTFRQMKLPWLEAAPPAWVKDVQSVRYAGSQTMHLPGSPPVSVPFSSVLDVQERGANWLRFALSVTVQGNQPSRSMVFTGPGSVGGYWVAPAALRKMEAGVVDEDEMLGTRLEYSVQEGPQGRLGVLIETGSAHRMIWGYSLEDGVLTYSRWERPQLNQTTEVTLEGRR